MLVFLVAANSKTVNSFAVIGLCMQVCCDKVIYIYVTSCINTQNY